MQGRFRASLLFRALGWVALASACAPAALASAQTCCGRLDLPQAATQRSGNGQHELLLGAAYEFDRLADGPVELGYGTAAITSHRLALTVGYGVTSWFTPELSTALVARVIDQRAGEVQTRSFAGLADSTVLLKLVAVGAGAYAPGALRVSIAPGIALPTGRYRHDDEYGRIPAPAQIGTGAFSPVLALFAAFGLDGEAGRWLLLSSAVGRYSGENGEGYQPGNSLELASVVQLGVLPPFTFRLGPFARLTAADEQDGVELEASAGSFFGVRGGAGYSVSDQFALGIDLQVPLFQHVDGEQLDPIITASIGVLGLFGL